MKDEPTARIRTRKRLRVGLALGLLLILHPSSIILAQDPPLVGQPTANFYNAQGGRVKVAWEVAPAAVAEGDEIIATLVITGATNPQRIVRPDLKQLDPFQARFVITDNPDPTPGADAKEVRFSYRLRPRSRAVADVPTLEFHYHNPAAAVGKQFPLTTTGRPVPITVTEPPPKPKPPPVPLAEPDHLFAVATGPRVLDRPAFVPGSWAWLAVGLGGPLLALGWFVGWRRVYPDVARLARIRRSRAAKRATEAIRRAGRTADPPGSITAAVLGYLRARFSLPEGAVTPTEVGAALSEHGVPADGCAAVSDFLRAADAARFSPTGDIGATLAADARRLVSRLEGA